MSQYYNNTSIQQSILVPLSSIDYMDQDYNNLSIFYKTILIP